MQAGDEALTLGIRNIHVSNHGWHVNGFEVMSPVIQKLVLTQRATPVGARA